MTESLHDSERGAPPSAPRLGWLSAVLAGAVALGILAAPTSLAYLQSSVETDGVSLETGTAALTVTAGTGGTPQVYADTTFVANAVTRDRVTNTGSVPLALQLSLEASHTQAGGLGASLQFTVTASTDGCVTPGSQLWQGSVGVAQSAPLIVLAPGASRSLCVSYFLPQAAAVTAGQSPATTFTLTLTGTQVAA